MLCILLHIRSIPAQVRPSPVYPLLQVHIYAPGPVSVQVANSWQSSSGEPQFLTKY